ncbi:MAG TPA: energy transducer TonB [Rhodocyclaceae bacterium]|nr:TonB C-terminal domain-containing protein [Rhodocyclaceae bacterium]HMV55162.1 energy transducer TonB [Rhodocyclaceae bacterium]HMZ84167.1 energy transducer TonB [Rhodocyclaceae bacterium]HNA05016.1 energy transducer TonB [Rhodocyclaceae bacterium]HNB77546.1 energy transducer TonB [Rhodocyclaceae bacterium]
MSELAHPNGFAAAPQPGKSASMVLTVAVHGLLALFLFYGINWQTRPKEFSDVELYSAPPAVTPPPVERVEPKPEPRPEPRVEPKPEPKIEPKPEPKPEIALKEKEKPKPEVKPKPVEKPPVKELPKTIEKPQPKIDERDLERMRLEEELIKESARVDQQKRRVNEAAALENELARLGDARARAATGKSLASWVDKIRLKVGGNVIAPPGLNGNPEAEFAVSLLPDGGLIDVKLRKSSGSKALDEAIERAIRKSDPLPRPDDPGVFQRELTLKIRPYPS